MVQYPALTHISVPELVTAAGDPWALDATLRAGDPGQIAELARAFRATTDCLVETETEFVAAAERFHRSWNRENGEFPINDSAELRRVALSLRIQKDELPAIATTLQKIAADLAEAQRMSDLKIDKLNGQLGYLDMLIGDALSRDGDADVSAYEDRAIENTSSTCDSIQGHRDAYGSRLQRAEATLRLEHGYDPAAIEDVDGDAEAGPGQRGRTAEQFYEANQRATDEALVNTPGEMTPEKADAAARLRDFDTVTDPAADSEARRVAGERLDDFRMANFVGPLPVDPLTGADARVRARNRLDMQAQLEQGLVRLPDGSRYPVAPMTPDQATEFMNVAERDARAAVVIETRNGLVAAGMSGDGANQVVLDLMTPGGLTATGTDAYTKGITPGVHGTPRFLTPDDAKVLSRIAGTASVGLTGYQAWSAVQDYRAGGSAEDLGRELGRSVGGVTAGWGTTVAAGSFFGPVGTAVAAVGATILFGGIGDWDGLAGMGGAWVGRQFDNP
ncbi:hypothetical protein [Mycobacterium sp. ACS4331]|uniref:putative alpha/beta hydrolase n=1 Tax=Mycobacterium sp. ACS4331 TaxID=1834121 RepID=UPI0007FD26E3|nr:hypothetical protein [Mycobacterium sp. ACS4331]OBF28723.1 hypothetical protein A5727_25205 [Mycobacterium sp. ACS4331]